MSIIRRRLMQLKVNLPYGYELLNYIENVSTAYIDTDYVPTNNIKIKAKFRLANISGDNILFFGGNRISLNMYSGRLYYMFGSNVSQTDYNRGTPIQRNKDYEVLVDKGILTFDSREYLPNNTIKESTDNLILYHKRSLGAKARYYYFQIWDSDILFRDFIPVRRVSDLEIGLFDRVENKFHISPNGEKFIGG